MAGLVPHAGPFPRTDELRRTLSGRLLWFLDRQNYEVCGQFELKKFFLHLMEGHLLPNGHWDCGADHGGKKPLRPATLATYYRHFKAFFNHLVDQELLHVSPMNRVPRQ